MYAFAYISKELIGIASVEIFFFLLFFFFPATIIHSESVETREETRENLRLNIPISLSWNFSKRIIIVEFKNLRFPERTRETERETDRDKEATFQEQFYSEYPKNVFYSALFSRIAFARVSTFFTRGESKSTLSKEEKTEKEK